jgi:hypothetical protein
MLRFGPQPFSRFTQGGLMWHGARGECAWTATNVAKWSGLNPHCSRAKAWREQNGTEKRDQNAWNLRWGHEMEPLLREQVLAKHLNGRTFTETGLWIKRFNGKVIGASPDGLIGDDTVLEIKASIPVKAGKEHKPPAEGVTPYDIPQILMQMEMTDRSSCLYARYNGDSAISVMLCAHDSELLHDLLDETEGYFDRYVVKNVSPPDYKYKSEDWNRREKLEGMLRVYNRENVRVLPVIEWSHRNAQ